jgi:hypothetical protein
MNEIYKNNLFITHWIIKRIVDSRIYAKNL